MSDVNMEIKFEKTKFIQVHKEIIISKEDSYADLTYELGGTYNFVPGGRKPISKQISLLEYDEIVKSLLALNYYEILKENEFLPHLMDTHYQWNFLLVLQKLSLRLLIVQVKKLSKKQKNYLQH